MLSGGRGTRKVRQVSTETLQNEQGGEAILALGQGGYFSTQSQATGEDLKLGERLGLCLCGTRCPGV